MFCSRWMGLSNQISIRNSTVQLFRPRLRVECFKNYLVGSWTLERPSQTQCVRSAWKQIEYVNGSRAMFFMLRRSNSQIQVWDRKLLVVTLHDAVSSPEACRKAQLNASYVFGRRARVFLAPLFYHASRSSSCLSKRLQATLKWWLCFLESIPVRRIPSSPVPSVVLTLYADATGHTTLVWVAEGLSKRVFSRGFVPRPLRRWMHRRRQQITTWELVATLCAVWYFLGSPARLSESHLQIHLCIDTNVALGTLLRGTSRQSYWNDLDTGIWFEPAAQSSAAPRMTGSFEVESDRCFGAFLPRHGVLGAQVALHATSLMALSLTPPWHSSSLIPGHFGSSDR